MTSLSHRLSVRLLEFGKELARKRAGMARKHVEVDGHRMAYFERGVGEGETVVLLHGFGANKDGWLPYAQFLRGYHLVIPDLPGFGDSDFDRSKRYGYSEQPARVKSFVDTLGLSSFHLAGNSMGGAIAGIYAATYPGDVKTLLLMDNAAVEMPVESLGLREVQAGRNPLIVRSVPDVDVLFEYVFHRPLPVPKLGRRIFASEGMSRVEANEATFSHIWDDWTPLQEVLDRIQAPTLVMWGKQDKIVDVSIVDVMKPKLKNAQVVIYDGCGHLPYLELPKKAALDHRAFIEASR